MKLRFLNGSSITIGPVESEAPISQWDWIGEDFIELDEQDEAYERAAARARLNDFEDTDGKDWT